MTAAIKVTKNTFKTEAPKFTDSANRVWKDGEVVLATGDKVDFKYHSTYGYIDFSDSSDWSECRAFSIAKFPEFDLRAKAEQGTPAKGEKQASSEPARDPKTGRFLPRK